jgi:TolB-like protein/DNA-binding winged helix-turn-helix (wHTH) protein/tetratricopeptide (TPR) repeat protein
VFGDFAVDLNRGLLTRCGEEIAVRPKALAVLLYLLEHAGRLVPREELLDAVWRGVVVTDDSVAQCVLELRRALGDHDRTIIRTVPRRGLIFDIPVRNEQESQSPDPPPSARKVLHRWAWAAAFVAVAVVLLWWTDWRTPTPPAGPTQRTAIAVLRFADMSPPPGHSYLADGFSEEILQLLAQHSSLHVISRTSSFAMDGQPVAAIAEQLGVSHILEGSIRLQDDQVRVTAQLIDTESGAHLWSQSYDRTPDRLMDVQREIARAVTQELRTLLAEPADAPVDPRAYALFLEAKFFYSRRADGDKIRAQSRLVEALAIEPGFARAWAVLAAVAAARLGDTTDRAEDPALRAQLLEIQRHAVEQALEFGPNLPETHHRAAQYYFYNGDRAKALEHVNIARSIDPHHPLVYVALVYDLRNSGRVDEASRLVNLNVQRDPLNVPLRADLMWDLLWAGRFEDVRSHLVSILDFNPSAIDENPHLGQPVVQADILRRDFEAVAWVIERLPEGVERLQAVALLRHGEGHEADADSALERLASVAHASREWVQVAEVHAYREEPEQALAWLNRIELRGDCGEDPLWRSIYYSPFLARLGDEPSWAKYRSAAFELMQGCLLGLDLERAANA